MSQINQFKQDAEELKIGISLSGGGFRAAVFHIGVLKTLAEKGYLNKIKIISTVSGGSFTIALIFKLNDNKWPTDKEYIDKVLPKLKEYFTKISLGKNALFRLFLPNHWLNLFSRANVISYSFKKDWLLTSTLSDLPETPIWEINATTNETGKNWRFSKNKMGDWQFGYIMDPNYNISDAVAASAAFPGYIGRFSFKACEYDNWQDFNFKNKMYEKKKESIKYKTLHLSDGGLYNNLGEESLIEKLGETLINDINFLVVSDATQSLKIEKSKSILNPLGRTLRLIDIAMDQIKLLRVRAIHNFFDKNPKNGLYIKLGQYPELTKDNFDLKRITKIKTGLFRLSNKDYDELVSYGEEITKISIEKWYEATNL